MIGIHLGLINVSIMCLMQQKNEALKLFKSNNNNSQNFENV